MQNMLPYTSLSLVDFLLRISKSSTGTLSEQYTPDVVARFAAYRRIVEIYTNFFGFFYLLRLPRRRDTIGTPRNDIEACTPIPTEIGIQIQLPILNYLSNFQRIL